MKNALLVLGGAAVGGVLGYFIFFWIADQGLYGWMIPGALLGLGAGIAKNRSIIVAVICGILAIGLGLFAEWRSAPFIKDESLGYFLTHIHELKKITLVMLAVGGAIGFWIPFRRIERPVEGKK
jgi:hypothetical protein